uniref:Uncharacterized protein n=1 Tax=Oryzias sinensis TaxID=183150 RepID=A0A8C7Y6K1_9TELE
MWKRLRVSCVYPCSPVYSQRPGSQKRPGDRRQCDENRRLRTCQGCAQHRLLQKDHQREHLLSALSTG